MSRPLPTALPQGRPTNRFLVRLPDRRMPRALMTALVMGAAMVLVLSLIGWPRLKSTSIHYDLIRLRDEVDALATQEHALGIELELERAPTRLEQRAAQLGLVPPGPLHAMSMTRALASAHTLQTGPAETCPPLVAAGAEPGDRVGRPPGDRP
jgi:hypothetical protein